MSFARTDNSGLARWWWTIDRVTFACVLALIAIGLVLACAASPAATGSADSAGDFRYALKQVTFALAAGTILVGTSLLDPRKIRLFAAGLFGLALIGAGVALFGSEINGAHRWLEIGNVRFEPSEFLKPAIAVLAATFLADKIKRGFPGEAVTLVLLGPAVAILLLQPDVGQSALLIVICVAILFFAGLSYSWLVALGGGAAALAALTYLYYPHVRERLLQFFESGTGYQTGLALKAFEQGGVAGVGPGEGTIKYRLPDAHTDFIYAVAGEEFGLILCALIALLFGVITIRLLLRAARAQDPFVQLAGAGLAVAIGFQAFINMGVALSILPAKGMTLPLISYGGSSLFAVALTLGLALAVTRQRPHLPMEYRP
ncbi:MAG: FtsW/RodA/SpoVE family cell cycle protein [Alphaproteobacteria bacterium]